MLGPRNDCPDCGHSAHGAACLVVWMGEQCDCTTDATVTDEDEFEDITDDERADLDDLRIIR